jgi:hypothetical protein
MEMNLNAEIIKCKEKYTKPQVIFHAKQWRVKCYRC